MQSENKKYWNAYIAGVGLGLTLLASFVIMGRGLGASGGFTSIVSFLVNLVAPTHSESNSMYSAYLQNPLGHPLADWLVVEITGVVIGGFLSGLFSKRISLGIDKGERITSKSRLILAFIGGQLGYTAMMIQKQTEKGIVGYIVLMNFTQRLNTDTNAARNFWENYQVVFENKMLHWAEQISSN